MVDVDVGEDEGVDALKGKLDVGAGLAASIFSLEETAVD
jgi:hypothetical protein